MSISQGSKLSWSDIQNIYTSLNEERDRFGYDKVRVPSNPGRVTPTAVSNLKTAIEELKNNKYVGNTANTKVTVPSTGTLIYPLPFTTMSNTINKIADVCAFDSFTPCDFDNGFSSCYVAENNDNTFHSSSSGTANGFST